MAAAATDLAQQVGLSTATTLSAPGYTTGGTGITVGSTTNWPTATGVTFAIDTVTIVNGVEVQDAGSYNEYVGTVATATTITNMSWADGNGDRNYTAGSTTRVYIPVSKTRENRLVQHALAHADQDGTLKAGAVDVTAVIADGVITKAKLATTEKAEIDSGWQTKYGSSATTFPTPNTITYNGNRSYTCVFNSVDLTSTLSNGMRLKLTRTVAANTYMSSTLNGTTQYFTKVTPTGTLSTVTDNFTIMGFAQPTAYAVGDISCRGDAAGNNAFALEMQSTGQVRLIVRNGGAANFRYVDTYQSLPLNKKTHVAATWASGTVVIYFDGVSVPVTAASTGGTAPTTAGTGGDFSIGRLGAYNGNYFTGNISNVGVFNAVLSAATIKDYATRTLTGSETNCIGAWSLNNTANDQNAAANNLTAQGSATFTSGLSPFATPASGTSDGLTEFGIVTSTAFSTNTTLTVQVPEGCAIPTSGGVSAVSYSTQKVPYGFPAQRGKWQVQTIGKTTTVKSSPTANTWYNDCGFLNMNIPIGSWNITVQNSFGGYKAAATSMDAQSTFSTANNTESDSEFTTWINNEGASATFGTRSTTHRSKSLDLSAATVYYLNHRTTTVSAFEIAVYGTFAPNIITAENAYL